MARLDEYVFGYRRGKVENKDICKLANVLLRSEICSTVTHDGGFVLREKDRSKFVFSAKPKMRFHLSEPLGVYGFLYASRRRYGVLAALILLFCIFIASIALIFVARLAGK